MFIVSLVATCALVICLGLVLGLVTIKHRSGDSLITMGTILVLITLCWSPSAARILATIFLALTLVVVCVWKLWARQLAEWFVGVPLCILLLTILWGGRHLLFSWAPWVTLFAFGLVFLFYVCNCFRISHVFTFIATVFTIVTIAFVIHDATSVTQTGTDATTPTTTATTLVAAPTTTTTVAEVHWAMVRGVHAKGSWFDVDIPWLQNMKTDEDAIKGFNAWFDQVSKDPITFQAVVLYVLGVEVAQTDLETADHKASDRAIELKTALQTILSKSKVTLSTVPSNGINTGYSDSACRIVTLGSPSGNLCGIQIVLPDGSTFWVLAKCGNIVLPPGCPPSTTPTTQGFSTTTTVPDKPADASGWKHKNDKPSGNQTPVDASPPPVDTATTLPLKCPF